ncbi:MAG: metallophosphoesterase [Desulfobacter postgatei]|uniref:metallophosphoesterase n=1 Tax=Desulfobacter postgatei TaxID=2293 RepID=UPI0023F2A1A5|nr:metallophosphoesterase [Desulfobacter postgatei]MDD4273522.1 metallophosphoesterase [Desulfobacter postgatei]
MVEPSSNMDTSNQQIVVFSDAHVSKSWDHIAQCLGQAPGHKTPFLNPNRELNRFIDWINRSPHVKAVINNGDSIDYYFSDFLCLVDLFKNRPHNRRPSNMDLFNQMIYRLKKPYHAIAGNHDYRREAYNYAIWGTDHINLPKSLRNKHKHDIGHHAFRGLWELSSIMVNKKGHGFDTLHRGIRTSQGLTIGNYHCIFMDSGCDAFARAINWLKYIRQVVGARMISYDSEGFDNEELKILQGMLSTCDSQDILLFQHTPLINPKKSRLGKTYQLSIDTFDRLRREQKLCYSTILNNGGGLLKTLRDSRKNISLVSSHTHTARYFLIEKSSLKATEVSNPEFNAHRSDPGLIKHLTTLPLGHINPKDDGNRTGFLKISPAGFKEHILHSFGG